MALAKITLQNFRNHALSELTQTAHFNLLVGENGAGKTNVLEAISLLSPGRGLRRANLAELALKGSAENAPGAFAIGASLIEQGQTSARIGTYTEAERPTRRLVRINGRGHQRLGLERVACGGLADTFNGRPVYR